MQAGGRAGRTTPSLHTTRRVRPAAAQPRASGRPAPTLVKAPLSRIQVLHHTPPGLVQPCAQLHARTQGALTQVTARGELKRPGLGIRRRLTSACSAALSAATCTAAAGTVRLDGLRWSQPPGVPAACLQGRTWARCSEVLACSAASCALSAVSWARSCAVCAFWEGGRLLGLRWAPTAACAGGWALAPPAGAAWGLSRGGGLRRVAASSAGRPPTLLLLGLLAAPAADWACQEYFGA